MPEIARVAAAGIDLDGTERSMIGFTDSQKTGTGIYHLTLEWAIGVVEAVVLATPWGSLPRYATAELQSDETTLVIRTFDGSGSPVDAAFSVVVFRVL